MYHILKEFHNNKVNVFVLYYGKLNVYCVK